MNIKRKYLTVPTSKFDSALRGLTEASRRSSITMQKMIDKMDSDKIESMKGGAKLTAKERIVLGHLIKAVIAFNKLPSVGNTTRDFADAIHRAQDLIANRVARRADTDIWI